MEQEQEIRLTRGLQNAGKTTYAREWVAEDPDWRVRINRNDLRKQIADKYWGLSQQQEDTVATLQQAQAEAAIKAKLSVIIDDTNLKADVVKSWFRLAKKLNVPIHVVDIEFDLEECIRRDKLRDCQVGEAVIRDYYKRYFKKGKFPKLPSIEKNAPEGKAYTPNPKLPKAVWLDADGTACLMNGRGPYEYHRVGEDLPAHHIIDLVKALIKDDYKIVVMSGRDDICKEDTLTWFAKEGIKVDDIFMRPTGNKQPDNQVKHDLFWKYVAPKYDIRFALDDRQQVVDFTREVLKIPVLQVAPGDF